MEFLERYASELWFLVQEMAPWLLLGLIFAGLLKVYFPQKHIDKYLGKSNFGSSLNAALLGVPMPLCSCGVIPTGISFYKEGASKGAVNSFLISTPQTGIDSIFATYSMLGWPFAVLRPIVAFVTGIGGGMLTNWLVKDPPKTQSPFGDFKLDTQMVNGAQACSDDACGCHEPRKNDKRHSLLRAVDYAFVELLQDIAKWLVIGFLFAALISVLLPNDFFSRFQGWGIFEILMILAASVPLYICATGSIPVAAVLLMKGVSPGAALVFLMAGPATNVATMTVLGKTMGKKSLAVYMLAITVGAVLFGLLTNWLIPADFMLSKVMHMSGEAGGHEMLPGWLELSSAVFLVFAIVAGYFYGRWRKGAGMKEMAGTSLRVEGMTCSHCEANVKRSLESLSGIQEVMANSNTNTVKIYGSGYKLEKVKSTIEDLGYRFIREN